MNIRNWVVITAGVSLIAATAFAQESPASRFDASLLGEIRDTIDFDFQHRFALTPRQEIIWGVGYRFTTDKIGNSLPISFEPDSRALSRRGR